MWELFIHPSNIVFSISLCLMFLFGLLEILLTLIGGGSQGFLDQFLPEDLGHHAEIGLDAEPSAVTHLLDWLYLGRIPLFVWLIIFLCSYSLLGFMIQGLTQQILGFSFSAWIIAPACLFLCMPFVRFNARWIARVLPQDETTALHSSQLIGYTALIILGDARPNSPAQAKLIDQHGQTHYVLVEPEQQETFYQGQSVVLTQQTNNGYQAILLTTE